MVPKISPSSDTSPDTLLGLVPITIEYAISLSDLFASQCSESWPNHLREILPSPPEVQPSDW